MKINPAKLLSQAWLVLILAILYGSGLAFVNITLAPLIAENQRNETYSLIPTLVGDPEQYNVEEQSIDNGAGDTVTLYKVTDPEQHGIGWVIPASSLGFADKIQILVGVDADCSKILGMKVIDQKETPGLGNLIAEEKFTKQFQGKSTDKSIAVVKLEATKSEEIQAVTGATISSTTVANAVNSAIGYAKPHILKQTNG